MLMGQGNKGQADNRCRLVRSGALWCVSNPVSITSPRPSARRIERGYAQLALSVSDCSAQPVASIALATHPGYRSLEIAASVFDQA